MFLKRWHVAKIHVTSTISWAVELLACGRESRRVCVCVFFFNTTRVIRASGVIWNVCWVTTRLALQAIIIPLRLVVLKSLYNIAPNWCTIVKVFVLRVVRLIRIAAPLAKRWRTIVWNRTRKRWRYVSRLISIIDIFTCSVDWSESLAEESIECSNSWLSEAKK